MLEMASVARCLIPTSGVTMDGQPITFAGSRAHGKPPPRMSQATESLFTENHE